MKNTKTWVKVLLLAFCLVFVFSSLIACGTDEELAKLQSQIDELKNKGDETATDLDADKAAKEAAIAELRTLIDAVKKTADAAATAAKLEEVVTALETADDANAKALADAEAAIKALINDNATADATTKEALEKADAEIKALAEAAATKAEFNEAVKTLNDTLATKKALEEADAALKKLIADGDAEAAKKLDELKKTVEEDVAKKIDEVQKAIAANGENDAKVQDALEAADKAITDKVTALEGTMTEVQKTLTTLGEKDADLQNQINAVNEALATKADKDTVDAAIEAVKTQINEEISTKLNALQTEVTNFKADIAARVEALETATGDLETTVGTLTADVEDLKAALAVVQGSIDEILKEDFAGNYNKATEVLNGTYVEDGEPKYTEYSLAAFEAKVNAVDPTAYTDEDYAAFLKTAEDIKFFLTRAISVPQIQEYFGKLQTAYDEMPTLVESLKKEIIRINTEKAINLAVTAEGDYCLTKLYGIYNKIVDKTVLATEMVTINEIEVTVEAAFNTVVAAYNNLYAAVNGYTAPEGAEDKTDAIEVNAFVNNVVVDNSAKKVGILYKQSDASVAAARAAFDKFAADFFANTAYTALYSEDCNEASEVVATYETLVAYEARVAQLKEAAAEGVKPTVPALVLNFADAKPLYTDYNALNILVNTTIATWRSADKGYNIDDVNYELIFTVTYEETIVDPENPDADPTVNVVTVYEYQLIAKAYAYATAMNNIYNEQVYVVETNPETEETTVVFDLVAKLTELCAKEKVVYTDLALVVGEESYTAKLAALKAAIEAVDNFDPDTDNNYETMIGTELLAKYEVVKDRMEILVQAFDAVAALKNGMSALFIDKNENGKFEVIDADNDGKYDGAEDLDETNVTFADWDKIEEFKNVIDYIMETFEIEKGDANYDALIAEVAELYEMLYDAYARLTEKVAEMYLIIEDHMNNVVEWTLADGHKVYEIFEYWNYIVGDLLVSDPDLVLTLIFEDGSTATANLNDLDSRWATVGARYVALAEAAAEAAANVNEAIAGLADLNANDIKDYAAIKETWDLFAAWATDYLGLDMTKATKEEIAAAVKAVQNIGIIGTTETYTFVSEADFETVYTTYTTSATRYNAAVEAWNGDADKGIVGLKDKLQALIDAWTIHSDFASVNTAWADYTSTYYAGVIDAELDLFAEIDLYNTYIDTHAEYERQYAAAKLDAKAIKDAIAALATLTDNDAIIAAVDAIDDMVEAYLTNYGCDILAPCAACEMTFEEVLTLAKADAKSEYTKAVETFKTTHSLSDTTVVTLKEVDFQKSVADGNLLKATALAQVESAKSYLLNKLVQYELTLKKDAATKTLTATVDTFITDNALDATTAVTKAQVEDLLADALELVANAETTTDVDEIVANTNAKLAEFQATIDAAATPAP